MTGDAYGMSFYAITFASKRDRSRRCQVAGCGGMTEFRCQCPYEDSYGGAHFLRRKACREHALRFAAKYRVPMPEVVPLDWSKPDLSGEWAI